MNQNKYKKYIHKRSLRTIRNHQVQLVQKDGKEYRVVSISLDDKFQKNNPHITRPFQKLQRKIQKYKNISHQFIVPVADTFVQQRHKEKKMVIVNEMDQGKNISTFIKKRQFNDLEHLKYVLISLASAVLHLHSHNIIHSDLNLESIRLDRGKYKLCFNQFKQANKYLLVSSSSQIVESQQIYFSPEKYQETGYDQSADVWALGIVFLELVLGDKVMDMTNQVLPCKFQNFPHENIVGRLSNAKFRKLLTSMLQFNPQKRIKMPQVLSLLKQTDITEIDSNVIPFQLPVNSSNSLQIKIFLFDFSKKTASKSQKVTVEEFTMKNRGIFDLVISLYEIGDKKMIGIQLVCHRDGQNLQIFIEEPLNSFYRLHFRSIQQLFNELRSQGAKRKIQFCQDGTLVINIDGQRAAVLRQINRGEPNYSSTKNNDNESGKTDRYKDKAELEYKDRLFAKQLLLQSIKQAHLNGNHHSHLSKICQQKSDGTTKTNPHSSQGIPTSKSSLSDSLSLYKQALALKSSAQYTQALELFIIIYESIGSQSEMGQYYKQTCMKKILEICIKCDKPAQLQKYLQMAKQSHPNKWYYLQLAACSQGLVVTKTQIYIRRILDRLQKVVDFQQEITSMDVASIHYHIFVLMIQKEIGSLDFAFNLIAKTAQYFLRHPDDTQCLSNYGILLNKLKKQYKEPSNSPAVKNKIKQFILQHMPDNYDYVFGQDIPSDDQQSTQGSKYIIIYKSSKSSYY